MRHSITLGRIWLACTLPCICLCLTPGWPGAAVARAEVAPMPGQIREEITVETLPAVTILSMPMHGSYDQHEEAILVVASLVQSRDIARGAPFGLYHNSPSEVPVDSLEWEICMPVAQDTRVDPPFVVRTLPETVAAVAICTGPYDQTRACHAKLAKWIAAHDYTQSGPTQEHWLSDLGSVPAQKLLARLVYPVVKKE